MGYERTEVYTCDRCGREATHHRKGANWMVATDDDAKDPLEGWFDIGVTEHVDGFGRDEEMYFCPPCAMVILDLIDGAKKND